MSESVNQPQSDTPSDLPPVIIEPVLPKEEPSPAPARWQVSRSALLLIGVPIAGALLVWLALSTFGSNSDSPAEVVAEQPASEPAGETQPAIEAPPAAETSMVSSAEAEPEPAETEIEQVAAEPAQTVDPEPLQQPDAQSAAVNEVIPTVPQSALDTIRGTVRTSIRVTIDKQGNVVDAGADDGGPSRYFEKLSINASKKWTFPPADSEEQRTMLVKFAFTRDGVTAQADPDEDLD